MSVEQWANRISVVATSGLYRLKSFHRALKWAGLTVISRTMIRAIVIGIVG